MENVVIKDMQKNLECQVNTNNALDVPECNDAILVYGIYGIESIKTRECVKSYIDEGDSVLLDLDINCRRYKVRVLKEHPRIGIMVEGHTEPTP